MTHAVNITGVGAFFPEQVQRNSDFAWQSAGVTEQRISKYGVLERRWASPAQTILDLARGACERALECAGIAADQVDRLILVTSTLQPGILVPSGAIVLQDQLGMKHCQSTTLLETCCGSLLAMEYAAALIRAGMARNVVVVASETFSKTFNPHTPLTFEMGMVMGDGAGAAVFSSESCQEDGLIGSITHSSSDFQSGLGMRPVVESCGPGLEARLAFGSCGVPPSFRGKPVAGGQLIEALHWFTTTTVPSVVREVLAATGLHTGQIDFFLLHQPSRIFLDSWKRECEIPQERTHDTLATLGNLSSVSLLANLDSAWQQGRLKENDLLLLAAAGEGACWGSMIWKWRLPLPKKE